MSRNLETMKQKKLILSAEVRYSLVPFHYWCYNFSLKVIIHNKYDIFGDIFVAITDF